MKSKNTDDDTNEPGNENQTPINTQYIDMVIY